MATATNAKRVALEQPRSTPFPAVVMDFPQRARRLRIEAMVREMMAIVVPPIIVLSLLLLIWQLAATGPRATLPTPLKIWQDAKDLIVDTWFVIGTPDSGIGWLVIYRL